MGISMAGDTRNGYDHGNGHNHIDIIDTRLLKAPIVTLSNNLIVCNFSSPHTFLFEDGSVLAACSPERSKRLSLEAVEQEMDHVVYNDRSVIGVKDIELKFLLTMPVIQELIAMAADAKSGAYDIVLVPLPVMQAMKSQFTQPDYIKNSPFRCIRSADRVKKTVCISKFCL